MEPETSNKAKPAAEQCATARLESQLSDLHEGLVRLSYLLHAGWLMAEGKYHLGDHKSGTALSIYFSLLEHEVETLCKACG